MMLARALFLTLMAAALIGCAPLTAEVPLFSPSDQIGPPPLSEGFWIAVSDECPVGLAHRRVRLPRVCTPGELRRLPDGAWLLRSHIRAHDGQPAQEITLRMVIAPATEHPNPQAFSPLYLAEYAPLNETGPQTSRYAAIAPIGALPATEILVVGEIDCTDALRDGPIEAVGEVRDDKGALVRCIANNRAAVREAVRRAVIENLNHLDQTRLVLVRR